MKAILSALFLIFQTFIVHAQTHRFIYEVQYKPDSLSTELQKEYYNLDFSVSQYSYYNRDYFISDSLERAKQPSVPPHITPFIISKKGEYLKYELMGTNFFVISSHPNQDWKLQTEFKEVQGIHLQQATCTWKGRQWVAWFDSEVPIPIGPYKFHGLPGIIFELHDTKSNYSFILVKSQILTDPSEIEFLQITSKDSIPISKEKYDKMKLSYYNDPLTFINNGEVDLSKYEGIFLPDGTKVTQKNLRDVTIAKRKELKKYNNPIELSDAVRYP